MRSEQFYGSWWRPENPSDEVPGVLEYDADGLRLVLHGKWATDQESDGSEGATPVGGWVSQHFPILHGMRHSDWTPVSLLDVRGQIVHLPFRTFGSVNYSADMALVGQHVGDLQSFTRVSFELDYLSAWIMPPARSIRTSDNWDILRLDTRAIELARCETPDNGHITVRTGLSGTEGASSVQLNEHCVVDIDAPLPSEREYFLSYIRQLRDLLVLCLGRPVRVKWVTFHVATLGRSMDALYQLDEPLEESSIDESQARNNVLNYRMPTLLMPGMASVMPSRIPLRVVLRRWLRMYPLAADTLSLLHAQYVNEAMLPHHRYASLFSAAEELHKKLQFPSFELTKAENVQRRKRVKTSIDKASPDLDEADSEWLTRLIENSRNDRSISLKLQDIFSLAGPVGSLATGAAPNLFRDAPRSRGQISHGESGSESAKASRLSYELAIEWVLRAVLISQLINKSDRGSYLIAASQHARYELVLRRLAFTEAP